MAMTPLSASPSSLSSFVTVTLATGGLLLMLYETVPSPSVGVGVTVKSAPSATLLCRKTSPAAVGKVMPRTIVAAMVRVACVS